MTSAPKDTSGTLPAASAGAGSGRDDFDYDALVAQIDEEVAARRQSGELAPGFERELDDLFSRYAPAAASEDFDAVLDEAARRAAIEGTIPVESNRRGGALVKQGIARTLGWYHAFLAEQLIGFSSSITHAVRLLGRRTEELEAAFRASLYARVEAAQLAASTASGVGALVAAALDGVAGRVLVAESGDGELLATLVGAGVDGYGIDPRRTLVDSALGRGLDVHRDPVREHLSKVEPGGLDAVVLTGFVEYSAAGELIQILELALSRVSDHGRIVVASRGPGAAAIADPIAADLAAGRPFHPRTWQHLLAERGWESETQTTGPLLAGGALGPSTGNDGEVADALKALSELLGPAAYVVTAASRPQ